MSARDTDPRHTLTGLGTLVGALVEQPAPDPQAVRLLASYVEDFAARTPQLDPPTHVRLLVRLARVLDPATPVELDAARRVLGLTPQATR